MNLIRVHARYGRSLAALFLVGLLSACGGDLVEIDRDYHLDDADGGISFRFQPRASGIGSVVTLRNDGEATRYLRAEFWTLSYVRWGDLHHEMRVFVRTDSSPLPYDPNEKLRAPFPHEEGQIVWPLGIVLPTLPPNGEETFVFDDLQLVGSGIARYELSLQWMGERT